jgi:hypothetical protein
MESEVVSDKIALRDAIEQCDQSISLVLQDIDETLVRCQELMAQLIYEAAKMKRGSQQIYGAIEVSH